MSVTPIECYELLGQQVTATATANGERVYAVKGTSNLVIAQQKVEQNSPKVWGHMLRAGVAVQEVEPEFFRCRVSYKRTAVDLATSDFSLDIGNAKIHQSHSLGTVGAYTPTGDAVLSFNGAVGVERDATGQPRVNGVDVIIPTMDYRETHTFSALIAESWVKKVASCVGTVNNATFRNFAAGEVLFVGAQGNKTGTEAWTFTFGFQMSANVANLRIGNILVKQKRGHDYLWIYWGGRFENNTLLARPVQVNVEQLYQYTNFSNLLGI